MYRCMSCQRVSRPREKSFLIPASTRPKTYELENGQVAEGWEIVRENRVCEKCNEKYEALLKQQEKIKEERKNY